MSKMGWLILGAIVSPLIIGAFKITVFLIGLIVIIWFAHVLQDVLVEENEE